MFLFYLIDDEVPSYDNIEMSSHVRSITEETDADSGISNTVNVPGVGEFFCTPRFL